MANTIENLLTRDLLEVFGEQHAAKRRSAIAALCDEDGVFANANRPSQPVHDSRSIPAPLFQAASSDFVLFWRSFCHRSQSCRYSRNLLTVWSLGHQHGSVVVQAKRKRYCRSRFFHFSRSQPRDTIADVAFGNGLEIVKVRSASVRQAIVFSQHDFCRNAADCRGDRCNGYRVQHPNGGIARNNQYWSSLVGCLEGIPANIASIHDAPQSCSLTQTSNSPGATGFRAYPSAWRASSSRIRCRRISASSASRMNAERVVFRARLILSTNCRSRSSMVI
jgi:hypothetical protein